MKKVSDLKVGDAVWIADVNRRGLDKSIVSKVGTKRVQVGRNFYRKETGTIDDEYGHAHLIPDLDEWNEGQQAAKIIQRIRTQASARDLKVEQALIAAKALGIDVSDL